MAKIGNCFDSAAKISAFLEMGHKKALSEACKAGAEGEYSFGSLLFDRRSDGADNGVGGGPGGLEVEAAGDTVDVIGSKWV